MPVLPLGARLLGPMSGAGMFSFLHPKLFERVWLPHAFQHLQHLKFKSTENQTAGSLQHDTGEQHVFMSKVRPHLGMDDTDKTEAKRGGFNSCSSPRVQIVLASECDSPFSWSCKRAQQNSKPGASSCN